MNFKDKLINFKKELEVNNNYTTKYIGEIFVDNDDFERELHKKNFDELQTWPIYNKRKVIENSKSQNIKKTFKELEKGIKTYIAFLLEKQISFDSIDLEVDIRLFIKEEIFKRGIQNEDLNLDNFLMDTIAIKTISCSTNDIKYQIVSGKELVVSYKQFLDLLNNLGFDVIKKSFTELVEQRKNNKYISINSSISLTLDTTKKI